VSSFEPTGIAHVPLSFLRAAPRLGLDPSELLRRSGLREEDLRDPDARVPLGRIVDLWRAVIERVPDPVLGISLGRDVEVRHYGLVGYAMYYSPKLGEALLRLARYCRVINEAVQCELKQRKEATQVVIDGHPLLDALRHPIDGRLAAVLATSRKITGQPIVPLEVRFPYPQPADVAAYESFFECRLRFGQPDAALVLDPAALELPVEAGDPALSGYLDRLADQALDSLSADATFTDRVRRAIWTHLSSGAPTLQQTAGRLGVSSRTLQRRLRQDGTTFAGVLEVLRRDLAMKLLRNRSLAVYEIAFLLGYSEPSTFYRAFRRWTGRSPQAFRRSAA
jgi:AraC-like DNA-binding protein